VQNDEDVSRRIFLERLAAGALLGAAGTYDQPARAQSGSGGWIPPPVLENPNILVIMVDQMRPPMWLNASQSAALSQTVLPNITTSISFSYRQPHARHPGRAWSQVCTRPKLFLVPSAESGFPYLGSSGGEAQPCLP
jgi:hypothetical protein